jgi:hypothetical protein
VTGTSVGGVELDEGTNVELDEGTDVDSGAVDRIGPSASESSAAHPTIATATTMHHEHFTTRSYHPNR